MGSTSFWAPGKAILESNFPGWNWSSLMWQTQPLSRRSPNRTGPASGGHSGAAPFGAQPRGPPALGHVPPRRAPTLAGWRCAPSTAAGRRCGGGGGRHPSEMWRREQRQASAQQHDQAHPSPRCVPPSPSSSPPTLAPGIGCSELPLHPWL